MLSNTRRQGQRAASCLKQRRSTGGAVQTRAAVLILIGTLPTASFMDAIAAPGIGATFGSRSTTNLAITVTRPTLADCAPAAAIPAVAVAPDNLAVEAAGTVVIPLVRGACLACFQKCAFSPT